MIRVWGLVFGIWGLSLGSALTSFMQSQSFHNFINKYYDIYFVPFRLGLKFTFEFVVYIWV